MPLLGPEHARQVATTNSGEKELKYRNFSIVISKLRRLAFFTAVNIDGSTAHNPPRARHFTLDPRLPSELQIGNGVYVNSDFDRGQLVRRLDPCWGAPVISSQGNTDTMYLPNIAPWHKDLNVKSWNGIEDAILSTVDERDLKISVFAGCVFREDDPIHPITGFKVPMAFWKVVASISRDPGNEDRPVKLRARAFIISQGHLVKSSEHLHNFSEKQESCQVTVEALERMTSLDFHKLKSGDSFKSME